MHDSLKQKKQVEGTDSPTQNLSPIPDPLHPTEDTKEAGLEKRVLLEEIVVKKEENITKKEIEGKVEWTVPMQVN